MLTLMNRFRRDETGASMIEYVLLIALIAVVAAVGAGVLGNGLSSFFNGLGTYVNGVPTNPLK